MYFYAMASIKFEKFLGKETSFFQQEKLCLTSIPNVQNTKANTNEKVFLPNSEDNILDQKFKQEHLKKATFKAMLEKAKHGKAGSHSTLKNGSKGEINRSERSFTFGDSNQQISMLSTLRNAQINHGIKSFSIDENDIVITEKEFHASVATVLLIDVSQSMILSGENRITSAKNMALALAEWIHQNYKEDTLEIVSFGTEAKKIMLHDIPKIRATASHTNISEAIELAMNLLRKQHHAQKQIFMITDGKPSCIKVNGINYTNSFGLDTKITSNCFSLAAQARKQQITITTFMLSKEEYLKQFIQEFTKINNGKVVFCHAETMEIAAFENYEKQKQSKI